MVAHVSVFTIVSLHPAGSLSSVMCLISLVLDALVVMPHGVNIIEKQPLRAVQIHTGHFPDSMA